MGPAHRESKSGLAPPSAVYVFPGQVASGVSGQRFTTVLGSCVSVCLFDPRLRVGGMNHFLLPFPVDGSLASSRFAGPAVAQLVGRLLGLGARQDRLVAKIFGGSVAAQAGDAFHVGTRNVVAARELLAAAGIPILDEDVGGPHGRRLVFDTTDGSSRVRTVGEAR